MKKQIIWGLIASFSFMTNLSLGQAHTNELKLSKVQAISIFKSIVVNSPAAALFDWKVGDTLNFTMHIKPAPMPIAEKIYLASITPEGMTLVQEMSYKTIKQTIEMLMDRDTGQIKQIKINGKIQKLPETGSGSGTKIITEEEVRGFKVAAGTFDAIHLVTEDSQGNQTEAWMNPRDIPLSGLLKSSSIQGNLFTIESELTSFARGH
jgi:hypothetical protein